MKFIATSTPCLPSLPEQIYSPLLSSFEVLATLKLLTMSVIKMVVGTKQITEVIKISLLSLESVCSRPSGDGEDKRNNRTPS